jgi:hypothetical protein
MDGLIEVRDSNGGYETRHGVRVEFGTDIPGQTRRLRALGCPERFNPKVIAKRNTQRNGPRQTVRQIDAEIARLQKKLAAKTTPAPRTLQQRLDAVAKEVAKDVAFLNDFSAKEKQERADDELRQRMVQASGATDRRKKYYPQ